MVEEGRQEPVVLRRAQPHRACLPMRASQTPSPAQAALSRVASPSGRKWEHPAGDISEMPLSAGEEEEARQRYPASPECQVLHHALP